MLGVIHSFRKPKVFLFAIGDTPTTTRKMDATVLENCVEFALVLKEKHAIQPIVNIIRLCHGVCHTLEIVITIGLDCMEGWNGMAFSVQQSQILNPWGNR